MIYDLSTSTKISVIGGTGKQGQGLVYCLAKAGYRMIIGSRDPQKAESIAKDIRDSIAGAPRILGKSITAAAKMADIVLLTVPYSSHREILQQIRSSIQDKLLVDVTVPLLPQAVTRLHQPRAGSAAQETSQILGKEVQVCTAFQNISYQRLRDFDSYDCDILVTGTSIKARAITLRLVSAAGFMGWDAGPLENSIVVEGLTSVLLNINKHYHSTRAGIKITGVRRD